MTSKIQEIFITKVEIFCYESHEHTVVSFINGINALVGTSNSGKSSFMRAVKWCLNNESDGDEFITVDKTESWVQVSLSNGYSIKRRKTRSGHVNTYEVFKEGVSITETPLTGFGTKVPPEVIEARGMGDLRFLFAHQLESAFLISETPGSRAKTIGNLEELGKVDQALQSTNDDLRVSAKTQKSLDKEIKDKEKQAERLRKEIEHMTPKVDVLLALKNGITNQHSTLQSVEKLHRRLEEISTELDKHFSDVSRADYFLSVWDDDLPQRVEGAQRLRAKLSRLLSIEHELSAISFMRADALQTIESLIMQTDERIRSFQKIAQAHRRLGEIAEEEARIRSNLHDRVASLDFTLLDKQITVYRTLYRHYGRIHQIENQMSETAAQVGQAREQIDFLLDQFVEALKNAQVCPTCAQSTAQVSCEHIQQIM